VGVPQNRAEGLVGQGIDDFDALAGSIKWKQRKYVLRTVLLVYNTYLSVIFIQLMLMSKVFKYV